MLLNGMVSFATWQWAKIPGLHRGHVPASQRVFLFPRILSHLCVTLNLANHKQCVYHLGETEDVP